MKEFVYFSVVGILFASMVTRTIDKDTINYCSNLSAKTLRTNKNTCPDSLLKEINKVRAEKGKSIIKR